MDVYVHVYVHGLCVYMCVHRCVHTDCVCAQMCVHVCVHGLCACVCAWMCVPGLCVCTHVCMGRHTSGQGKACVGTGFQANKSCYKFYLRIYRKAPAEKPKVILRRESKFIVPLNSQKMTTESFFLNHAADAP